MKNLIKQLKSYIAEKFIFWAICLCPESIFEKKEELTKLDKFIQYIVDCAIFEGWELIQTNKNSNLIQIKKKVKGEFVKMAIYYKKNSTMNNFNLTVSTSMNHSTKGKTQLHQKNVDKSGLDQLLVDPRTHTGKVYYKK